MTYYFIDTSQKQQDRKFFYSVELKLKFFYKVLFLSER